MKKVLVTGSSGFIGKNLCAQLALIGGVEIYSFDRNSTSDELAKYCKDVDFVFHLAGINRPVNESEFETGNKGLTEELAAELKKAGSKANVLFASSIQAELDNPYGKSKRGAEDVLTSWANEAGTEVYIYRLPNVFGKWSKPNYNTVVATFCHNIARGLEIKINDEKVMVTLAYIDDVVREFIYAMDGKPSKGGVAPTYTLSLGELVAKLEAIRDMRTTLVVPDLEGPLDRHLYSTYTSFLDEKDYSYSLDIKSDDRGSLAEFVKSHHSGQIFVSRTNPGFTRGNHWHHSKIEKFLVLEGEAEVSFRHILSGDVFSYKVSGSEWRVIDIPVGYVHALKNIGQSEMMTLIWADEIFNPDAPDTYFEEV